MSAELVDRIRLGWVVLAESGALAEGDVTTHPLQEDALLGLTAAREPCLLIPVAEAGPEEREGGVAVFHRELDTDEGRRTFVVVSCGEPPLRDVFDHFLAALVEAWERAPERHPAATALVVLARWRALFRPSRDILGPGELASLLAELMVLAEILERDPARSVGVWVGPTGARHDFRRGAEAIEVKSTLSHTAREAGINGIDQLEEPAGGSLTLAWYRLERAEDGPLSVFGLVDRLLAAGAPAGELYALLEQAGSPPALREAHDAVRFDLRECRFFAVEEDFPRIVPQSFPAGVPEGVDDLRYRIALPAPGSDLPADEIEALFERMAGTA